MAVTYGVCTETMEVSDHVHTCTGHHDSDGSHWCGGCQHWWWH